MEAEEEAERLRGMLDLVVVNEADGDASDSRTLEAHYVAPRAARTVVSAG